MGRGGVSGGGSRGGFSGGGSRGGFSGGGTRGGFSGGGSRGGFSGRGSSGGFSGNRRPEGGGSSPRPPVFVGGFRPSPTYRPPVGGNYGGGGFNNRPVGTPNNRPSGGGSGCTGCLTAPLVAVVLILLLICIIAFGVLGGADAACSSSSGSGIAASTVAREKLSAGLVNETGYYTDELHEIRSASALTAGMKNFYRATGVQPYLYLTNSVNGSMNPTSAEFEDFADGLYDRLFTDEAHLLLVVFTPDGNYYLDRVIPGNAARSVIDEEAAGILLAYVDRYFADTSLTYDECFSTAFDRTGERIMTVTKSPWPTVWIVIGVIVILLLLFFWWRKYKEQKNLEAKQTETILNTPLEKYGDKDAEDLAKKYEGAGSTGSAAPTQNSGEFAPAASQSNPSAEDLAKKYE